MKFQSQFSLLNKPFLGARFSLVIVVLMANLFFMNQTFAQIELDVSGGEVRGI